MNSPEKGTIMKKRHSSSGKFTKKRLTRYSLLKPQTLEVTKRESQKMNSIETIINPGKAYLHFE
jgi:hypothetical protein